MSKERIGYIDSVKGLAVLLMVMGHVVACQFANPDGILSNEPRSAMFLFRFIYSFHMHLLMFCSGLFALKIMDYTWKGLGQSIWKRFYTLMVPFFCAGLVQNLIKPNAPFDYWYLWALFQFVIAVLAIDGLCSLLPKNGEIISTVLIVVSAILVHLFYSKFLVYENKPLLDIGHWRFYPYFCMGVICTRYDLCGKWFSKNWVYTCALALFGLLTYVITIKGFHIPQQSITGCLLPISAIIACVYLFKEGLANNTSLGVRWLQDIGRHSLEIYIIHFFFLFKAYKIGGCVQKLANIDGGGQTIFL